MLRGSPLTGSGVARFLSSGNTEHLERILQGKEGGNIVVFGIVIGIIVGIAIIVMVVVLIYYFTCKPENVSRHNSTVTEDKAATCRDLGHHLEETTAIRLAEQASNELESRKYRHTWMCAFCNKSFRSLDQQTMYHCIHRECSVDLCQSCYYEVHRQHRAPVHTEPDLVLAEPIPDSARQDQPIKSIGTKKRSDGKVHPNGASAFSEIESHQTMNRSRSDESNEHFPTNFGSHEKKRRNSGSSVHSKVSDEDDKSGQKKRQGSGASAYEDDAHNASYAAIYLAGEDNEHHERHQPHYPKRRGSRDSQSSNDGNIRHGSSASSHASAAHAASYAAVYGDD